MTNCFLAIRQAMLLRKLAAATIVFQAIAQLACGEITLWQECCNCYTDI